jgi:hypothetical protein
MGTRDAQQNYEDHNAQVVEECECTYRDRPPVRGKRSGTKAITFGGYGCVVRGSLGAEQTLTQLGYAPTSVLIIYTTSYGALSLWDFRKEFAKRKRLGEGAFFVAAHAKAKHNEPPFTEESPRIVHFASGGSMYFFLEGGCLFGEIYR